VTWIDLHTLSQQIQSRDAHYETVGQVLLGKPTPGVFLAASRRSRSRYGKRLLLP
jgi:hypothetical protein